MLIVDTPRFRPFSNMLAQDDPTRRQTLQTGRAALMDSRLVPAQQR